MESLSLLVVPEFEDSQDRRCTPRVGGGNTGSREAQVDAKNKWHRGSIPPQWHPGYPAVTADYIDM